MVPSLQKYPSTGKQTCFSAAPRLVQIHPPSSTQPHTHTISPAQTEHTPPSAKRTLCQANSLPSTPMSRSCTQHISSKSAQPSVARRVTHAVTPTLLTCYLPSTTHPRWVVRVHIVLVLIHAGERVEAFADFAADGVTGLLAGCLGAPNHAAATHCC